MYREEIMAGKSQGVERGEGEGVCLSSTKTLFHVHSQLYKAKKKKMFHVTNSCI